MTKKQVQHSLDFEATATTWTKAKARAKPILVPAGPADPRQAELEATIRKQPDDPTAYLVLADILQTAGDPRGELITIQHARAANPDDTELKRAETRLLADFGPLLLGGLHDAVAALGPLEKPQLVDYVWRYGFIQRARVHVKHAGDDDTKDAVAPLVRELLASPSARFLEGLKCEVTMPDAKPMLKALADVPPTFREFRISSMEGDVRALKHWWRHVPQLRVLHLGQWGGIELGELELPALEDLELVGPSKKDVKLVLARAPASLRRLHLDVMEDTKFRTIEPLLHGALPQITDLRLQIPDVTIDIGSLELGGITALGLAAVGEKTIRTITRAGEPLRSLSLGFDDTVEYRHMAPIFEGALPNLRRLELGPIEYEHRIGKLARSPMLAKLEVLSLLEVDDDELRLFRKHADAFAHLREIRLLDSDGCDTLAKTRKKLPQLYDAGESWIED